MRWSVGSWKWKLVYAAKSFLASWLIWKKPDKLPLFILSKSKCHWASVAVQHLCFCSLHFVRVCLRLPSKFCQLWRKSSIFHLLASVQHRQLSLKEPFLTDSQPVTSAAAESHPPQFFRPSVIHPDVNAGAWSRAAATCRADKAWRRFTSLALWPRQKVPTRPECRRGDDEGAACSAETFKALWGEKKPVKLEGRVGSHFSLAPLREWACAHHTLAKNVHKEQERVVVPHYHGCVSEFGFIYLPVPPLCKVKHLNRCYFFFQRSLFSHIATEKTKVFLRSFSTEGSFLR